MELLINIQKRVIRGKKTIKDKQGDILLEMDRERERLTTIVITMIAIVILYIQLFRPVHNGRARS